MAWKGFVGIQDNSGLLLPLGLNPYALRFLGLECAAEGPSPNNCCHGYGFSIFMWRYLQALIIFDLWIPFSISLGYTLSENVFLEVINLGNISALLKDSLA